MGIKGINPLLKKYCPQVFKECTFDDLSGKTAAMDLGIHMNKQASGVNKSLITKLKCPTGNVPRHEFMQRLKHDMLMLVFGFMKRGLNIIVVGDGGKHPLKVKTLEKRSKTNKKTHEKAREAMEEYESMNPLEITDDIDKELLRLRSNDFYVSKAEQQQVLDMFISIGIPCLKAEYEAEKLCASLVIEGLADVVLSCDTDCYPLGAHITISDYDFSRGTLQYVDLEEIIIAFVDLFGLEEHETKYEDAFSIFIDLCIMSGCDFNDNMAGIAGGKAFLLLKKHLCIENIAEIKDVTCLNYEECREIFAHEDTGLYSDNVRMNWDLYDTEAVELATSFGSHPLIAVQSGINKSKLSRAVIQYEDGI